MPSTKTYSWQQMPVLRLLLPLVAGICMQWYSPLPFYVWALTSAASILAIISYFFFSLKNKFRFSVLNGAAITVLFLLLGAVLVFKNDIRNDARWFAHDYNKGDYLMVRLLEPLVEKQNSYKALADVQFILSKTKTKTAKGILLLYLKKDTSVQHLTYGSQLILSGDVQDIKNAGNPGSFDFRQYCLFQGITHQVYLDSRGMVLLPQKKISWIQATILNIRYRTVQVLRNYISGAKDAGLAEALLIGYKDDLDKNLVQAYSNTGVVHIIAISGLHLGLINFLLLWLTKPLGRTRKTRYVRLFLILAILWAFSLVAGAQPSVLRSAVMFSCISIAQVIGRRSSMYNALALSAFLLLCFNPFWLWDVGFQLSYSAVLSILVFFRPIYNWVAPAGWFKRKLWELVAATLAAQLFTLPLVIYHFHQFPLFFLFANLVAVPLSSAILIGELVLIAVSFINTIAVVVGYILQKLIWLMNAYVEWLSAFSFATWNGFSLSIWQAVFLYGVLAGMSYWLIDKNKKAIWWLLSCLSCFVLLRSFSFAAAYRQKEMIVYNVPKHLAIDLIEGRTYTFIGDSDLLKDDFIRNFHLQPSRILHRISLSENRFVGHKCFEFANNKILIIDSTVRFHKATNRPLVDIVVLSKNPKLYINDLYKAFAVKKIVMDGSVSNWKKERWKKDCDSLHLSYYDVSEKGAFVMKVQ